MVTLLYFFFSSFLNAKTIATKLIVNQKKKEKSYLDATPQNTMTDLQKKKKNHVEQFIVKGHICHFNYCFLMDIFCYKTYTNK